MTDDRDPWTRPRVGDTVIDCDGDAMEVLKVFIDCGVVVLWYEEWGPEVCAMSFKAWEASRG